MTVASVASSEKRVATEILNDVAEVTSVAAVATDLEVPIEKIELNARLHTRTQFLYGDLEKTGDSGDTGDSLVIVSEICRQSDLTTGDTGDTNTRGGVR